MTRFITLLALFTLLCACAPAAAPTATLTPTDVPATATPEPTPTATVEPTKSPMQIAAGLEGLNMEREYIVRGEYLVDIYNDAPKAVLQEDGTWRALDYENPEDAEVMYGHLVPMPGEGYVDPRGYIHYWNESPSGIRDLENINAVYLGEVDMETQALPDGTEVIVPYFRIGLRDEASGIRLHVAQVAYDAIGFDPPHWTPGKACKAGVTGEDRNIAAVVYPHSTIEELLDSDTLKPGMLLEISIYSAEMNDFSNMAFVQYSEKWPLANNTADQVNGKLFEMNVGSPTGLTEEEWSRLATESVWPDRTLRLHDFGIKWVDPVCARQ